MSTIQLKPISSMRHAPSFTSQELRNTKLGHINGVSEDQRESKTLLKESFRFDCALKIRKARHGDVYDRGLVVVASWNGRDHIVRDCTLFLDRYHLFGSGPSG